MTDENTKNNTEENIQSNLFVHCPKKKFALTRAVDCPNCDFFETILRVSEDERQEMALRIFCAHPITRSLTIVEV